jgi:hypothetical protein
MTRADRCGRRTGHSSGGMRTSALALTVGVLAPYAIHAATPAESPMPTPVSIPSARPETRAAR